MSKESTKDIEENYAISSYTLRKWEEELLGEEAKVKMTGKTKHKLKEDRESLITEVELLKAQIDRLELEKDILEGTVNIL